MCSRTAEEFPIPLSVRVRRKKKTEVLLEEDMIGQQMYGEKRTFSLTRRLSFLTLAPRVVGTVGWEGGRKAAARVPQRLKIPIKNQNIAEK